MGGRSPRPGTGTTQYGRGRPPGSTTTPAGGADGYGRGVGRPLTAAEQEAARNAREARRNPVMGGDPYTQVTLYDALGRASILGGQNAFAGPRAKAMKELSARNPDYLDVILKEAALSRMRAGQKKGRRATFVTGARGLEGPMGSLIGSGGTSLLGS